MHYKSGSDRHQLSLFVNSLEDAISVDHPVRLMDLLVDKVVSAHPQKFSLKGLSSTGRTPYNPRDLLKLYLYGYLNRITSSRRLETETYRNIELKWLLCDLHPDHKTIADFRRDNEEGIRFITLSFRRFLKSEGYIAGKKVIYDGTKVKACTSKESILSMDAIRKKMSATEIELDKYLQQLNENDNQDEQALGEDVSVLEKIASLKAYVSELELMLSHLQKTGNSTYCPNDIDANLMKSRDGFIPAYNVQVGTDGGNKMIVMAEVTTDHNDIQALKDNFNKTCDQLTIVPEIVEADSGYGNYTQIAEIESNEKTKCSIPIPDSPAKEQDKKNGISFTYEPSENFFLCSKGKKLKPKKYTTVHSDIVYNIYQAKKEDCLHCSLFGKCTKSKKGRTIKIPQDHIERKAYMDRVNSPEIKPLRKERKALIEHVFGTLKRWMGKIPLLLTTKKKVQIEIDLFTTVYNFKRLLSLETVPMLIKKMENYAF